MKNILLLYKKLWAENKTIIILYLLLLLIAAALLFRYDFYMAGANISRTTNQEIPWIYNQFQESTWAMVFVIVSFSFVISIHWGIRHFNYSSQSYHYNTLPLSLRQKLGFILSYVFLLLPALHVLILSAVFLPISTISAPTSFNKTPWELYTDVLNHLTGDTEKWFPFSHLYFFMAVFLLTALFFNRMGFIKTVVAATVIMITGMVLYVNLNFRLWETRGDFGSAQSVLRFPDLYTQHYTCIAVLFAALLYTVYQRLTDKNY